MLTFLQRSAVASVSWEKTQVIYQHRRISLMNKPFNYVLVLLYAQDYKIAGEKSK